MPAERGIVAAHDIADLPPLVPDDAGDRARVLLTHEIDPAIGDLRHEEVLHGDQAARLCLVVIDLRHAVTVRADALIERGGYRFDVDLMPSGAVEDAGRRQVAADQDLLVEGERPGRRGRTVAIEFQGGIGHERLRLIQPEVAAHETEAEQQDDQARKQALHERGSAVRPL